MLLKEIELIGFKSFADKTKLRFSPGITAIVGPNGCGKSNIADAFRWVFGEQSAKSLRGSKMPDVIFGGTTTRKALNFAEVTITFSDVQGALPTEFEEVAVTRRLHRSGDSEYFINRHPVRLKDIQSLFLDSGMGKDAYSIFEQGKIDQIINYSPLERRYIFEEAAGILRFLHRKREALRKLEQSDLNITRLKDIHKEVENQIGVLQRQSEEARHYQENQRQLIELEKGLLHARWDQSQQKRCDALKKEGGYSHTIQELKLKLEALKEELKIGKSHLQELEKAFRQRNEEVFKTRSDKEIKNRERLSFEDRLKEAMVKEKRWLQELELMIAKREGRRAEAQNLQKLQKAFEGQLEAYENTLKDLREAFQKRESEVAYLRQSQQTVQQQLLKLVQKENQLGSELKASKMRLESAEEQIIQTEKRQASLQNQVKELVQTIAEKQKVLQEISEEGEKQRELFIAMERALQEIAETLEKKQTHLDQLAQERADCRARQKVLLRLREEKEGFSAASKRLLQETTNPKSPLYQKLQPLFELVTVEETAHAALLRPYGQTLVVKTWQDFDSVVAFAEKNKLKDYSLFCQEGTTSLSHHFFNHLAVAETREEALTLNQEVWLKSGILLDRLQVFFSYAPSESHAFVRELELKGLEKRLQELDISYSQAEEALHQLQNERSRKMAEKVEQDKAVRKLEMRSIEVSFELQRKNGDRERLQNELEQLKSHLQALSSTKEKLNSAIQQFEEQYAEAKKSVQETQKSHADANLKLEELTTLLKREQLALKEEESAFHKISDDNRRALHAQHVHEVKDLESVQQEKRLEEEIQQSREFQNQMKTRTGEQDRLLSEVEILLAKVTEANAALEKEVTTKKAAVEQLEGRLQTQGAQLKKSEEQQHQIALHLAQIEATQTALTTDLLERFRLTVEDLRQENIPPIKSIEQAEKQMRALKVALQSAGAINLAAIEECKKHQERYLFLNQQMDDMALSKKELVEIIAELDGESRKLFQETFEKIRANFRKNFALLFHGGEADLQFTETADVLEAGIEIIARPPAKQMRSIQLLSGGEKCLTAMALLFAIFEVKPSPFCILDEIDAPLDDANVERFVRVVQQFVERTQFLIITHNKRTMAIADMLFGVSMEERGVSKMLSMEFARQPAPQVV